MNQNGAFYPPPYPGGGNPYPGGPGFPNGGSPVTPAYVPPKKPPVQPATGTDLIFCFLFFAVSFLIIDWALFGAFRLGFSLCYAVMFVVTVVYLCLSKPPARFTPFTVIAGLLSLAAAGVPAIYCSADINFLMVVTVLTLYAVMVGGAAGADLFSSGGVGVIGNLVGFYLLRPFLHIADSFSSIRAVRQTRKTKLRYVLLGMLISLPLLCIIIPLLTRADAAFEMIIKNIFGDLGKWIGRLILAILIFPFVFSVLWGVVHKKKIANQPAAEHKGCQIMPSAVAVTLLSVLTVFYLIYLFSQLAHFVDAFAGVFPKGYDNTVASYAKRGFYETIAISAINLTVVALITLFTKRENRKRLPVSTLIPVFFIAFFSLFLLASAAFKMYIYMDSYGLTQLRVWALVFLVCILIAWIAAIIKLLAPKFPYMRLLLVAWVAVGIAVGYADLDQIILSYNISAWQSGQLQELDLEVTWGMSDSIVPQLVDLLDSEDETVQKNAAINLRDRFFSYYDLNSVDDYYWYDDYGYYNYKDERSEAPSRETLVPYEKSNRFTGYNRSQRIAKALLWENYDRFKNVFLPEEEQDDSLFDGLEDTWFTSDDPIY